MWRRVSTWEYEASDGPHDVGGLLQMRIVAGPILIRIGDAYSSYHPSLWLTARDLIHGE
jgi:hypothetical protein